MNKLFQKFKSIGLLLKEFWMYLRVRKKWWLAPIIIVLVIISILIVLIEGSALAPFIYTLF